MRHKLYFALGFVFVVILVTAGSCGKTLPTPKAILSDLAPTEIDFGSILVDESDSDSFSFKNTGDANLIYELSENESWLSLSFTDGSVTPGDTRTITVTVTCPDEGSFSGKITVSSNGGSNKTVDVSVTCRSTPTELNFGSVTIGESESQNFKLTNTDTSALNYELSESEDWLSVSPTSGALNAGESVTITVTVSCSAGGSFSGPITVTTSQGDNKSITVIATCTPPSSADAYNIELRFIGSSTTPGQKAAFELAELRWESVITGDLEHDVEWTVFMDEAIQDPDEGCDPAAPSLVGETIDDLVIFAKVGPIDGAGDGTSNTLAQAGPTLFHDKNSNGFFDFGDLTLAGCMIFDEHDLDQLVQGGSFSDVVLHEMGHVLGIGTLWKISGVYDLYDSTCRIGGGDVGFTGEKAVIEFDVLGGSGNPPIEGSTRQRGTDCGHWDEEFFNNELMTGRAESSGTSMPLSRLTIASLEDIGYTVDYSAASSYSLPSCRPSCSVIEPLGSGGNWEVLLQPVGLVGRDGKVTKLNPSR